MNKNAPGYPLPVSRRTSGRELAEFEVKIQHLASTTRQPNCLLVAWLPVHTVAIGEQSELRIWERIFYFLAAYKRSLIILVCRPNSTLRRPPASTILTKEEYSLLSPRILSSSRVRPGGSARRFGQAVRPAARSPS